MQSPAALLQALGIGVLGCLVNECYRLISSLDPIVLHPSVDVCKVDARKRLFYSQCMTSDDSEINVLFEEMMHGPIEALSSIVYGYDRIGSAGQQVIRGMIERLREPGRTERLQIRERRIAGHFEMVIAFASWRPHWSADGFLPFIIGRNDSRPQVLGYVLPFNPVMELLTAEDRENAFALSKCWVAWIQSYKKAPSKPQ